MTRRLIWMLMGAVLVSACSEVEVEVQRLKPAKLNLAGVTTLAVTTLEGREGDEIADIISNELEKSGRFKVINRRQVFQVLAGRRLMGLAQEQILDLGRALGADAIIYGRTDDTLDINIEGRDRPHNQGNNWRSTRYTRTLNLRLNIVLKAIDIGSGQSRGEAPLKVDLQPAVETYDFEGTQWEEHFVRHAPGQLFRAPDQRALRREAYGELPAKILRKITPHYTTELVTFYHDRRLPLSGQAIAAAQRNDWSEAIALYRQGAEQADADARLSNKFVARAHYNLGVALTYAGEFEEGLEELEVAMDLSPQKRFLTAYGAARIYASEAEIARLQSLPPSLP